MTLTPYIPERRPVRSKRAAQQAAESLVARLGCTAPVPVEQLAAALGVKVIAAPGNPSLSGAFVISDGRAYILYNEAHVPVRQRFSIAHELGHYLLHSRPGEEALLFRDDHSSLGTDFKEIQANAFASALLMPEAIVRRHVPTPIPGAYEGDIDELARAPFNVSTQAMTYRLKQLGLYTPSYN